MIPLSLTVQLYERENALSFISRIAQRNGLNFAQDFCADKGLKWMDVTRGSPEALSVIAEIASVDPKRLTKFSVRAHDGRRYSINREILSHGTLHRRILRYCASCLEHDQHLNGPLGRFGRLEWQLTSFRTCPIHGTLLETLPNAGGSISPHDFWHRIDEFWDHEVARAARDPQFTTFGTDIESYLIRRLVGETDGSWLGQLELDVVCRLCEGLGIALVYGSKVYKSNLKPIELARATAAGFRSAKMGQQGLRKAFEEISVTSPCTVKGYLSNFGALTRWFRTVDTSELRYKPIIDEITEYIFSNYAIEDGQTVLGRTCPKRRIHCLSTAASAVGLSNGRVAKFAAAMGIERRNQEGSVSINADKHDRLLEEFASCITCSEARERLGLSFEILNRFNVAGLLKPRFDLPELSAVYHPDDIAKFEASIFGHATQLDRVPLGFRPINTLATHRKYKVENFIQLIQLGRLQSLCFQSGKNGLWNLHADPDEVRYRIKIDSPDGFTKEQLRSLLCISSSTACRLVRFGYLKSDSVRHRWAGYQITIVNKEALKTFLEQYVTLGIVARDRKCQAMRAVSDLEKLGLKPFKLGKHCSFIYHRLEIEQTPYQIGSSEQHYSEAVSRLENLLAAEKNATNFAFPPSIEACSEQSQ